MQDGEYPTQMKIAIVIALYKKEKNITLISTVLLACYPVSTNYLKILGMWLIKFPDENNPIFKFQFGFRYYIQQHLF